MNSELLYSLTLDQVRCMHISLDFSRSNQSGKHGSKKSLKLPDHENI